MIKKLLTAALVAILFASCNKETHCPAFPYDLEAWISYYEGEEVEFTGPRSSQSFTIVESNSSKFYTVGRTEACECESSARSKTNIDSTNNIQLICYANKLNRRTDFEFKFQHYGYYNWVFYFPEKYDSFRFCIKDNGGIESATYADGVKVGGKTYDHVIVAELDTATMPGTIVYKIYIAQNEGIIKYCHRRLGDFELTHRTERPEPTY